MKHSRPLVVVLAGGLAILPAACGTLTGSGGSAKKGNPSDSTVFRTITVVVQTTQTTQPPATGGAPGAQSAATQTTLDPSIYEVKDGDSWYGIAKKLKVDVNALLAANNATLQSSLFPGRRLAKPGATTGTGTGTGTGGVLPPPGAGSSGSGTTAAASATLAPGSAGGSYQIQAGDYWLGIAKKLNVSLNALLAANGATTSTVLLVGKYLKVPQG
jgi:LysM repeat protein